MGNFRYTTWFLRIILILGAILSLTATCQADPQKTPLVTGEYAPFVSQHMEGYGCVTQLITDVLQEMDLQPQYTFSPWPRCEKSVERGEAWATFPYAHNPKRAERFWFSAPLVYYTSKLFYYKEKPEEFQMLEDLKPYRIGGVLGYFYEEMFETADLNVEYAPSEESALNMLVAGRVDLIPFNEVVGWYLIKKKFPDEAEHFGTLQTPLNEAGLFLMVSRTYPQAATLLERFNAALRVVKARPEYQNMVEGCTNSVEPQSQERGTPQ